MKRKTWFLILFILMFITALDAADVTLVGIVEVSAEDEEFNPVEITLMVDTVVGEKFRTDYYIIDLSTGKGAGLLKNIEEKVRVTGTVRTDRAGTRHIIVKKYELVIPAVPGEIEEIKPDTIGMRGPDLVPGETGGFREYDLSEEDINE